MYCKKIHTRGGTKQQDQLLNITARYPSDSYPPPRYWEGMGRGWGTTCTSVENVTACDLISVLQLYAEQTVAAGGSASVYKTGALYRVSPAALVRSPLHMFSL